MKKKGKQVLVILFVSLILISSVSMVSAAWYSPFTDWLKDLFNIGEDSDLSGELGNLPPGGSGDVYDGGGDYCEKDTYLEDCLKAYYKLDNKEEDFEQDFSGNEHHGQVHGDVYYKQGVAVFDGDEDYIEADYFSRSENSVSSETLSAWVYPHGESSIFHGSEGVVSIMKKESCTNCFNYNPQAEISFDSETNEIQCYASYYPNGIIISSPISIDKWAHVVCVYDYNPDNKNMGVSLYVNGVIKNTDIREVESYSYDSEILRIGLQKPVRLRYFAGSIDEVKVYGKALIGGEVSNLYNAGRGVEPPAGCIDSDVTVEYPDGINYGVKGILNQSFSPSGPKEDSCLDSNNLTEWSCVINGTFRYEVYDCSLEGKTCSDGACVETPVEDVCGDGTCDAGVTYGDVQLGEIFTHIQGELSYDIEIVDISPSSAVITVNGELKEITEGGFSIVNGLLTYIIDIDYTTLVNFTSDVSLFLGEDSRTCPEDCELSGPNPYLIEEDIGVLEYSETFVGDKCGTIININCEQNEAIYYPSVSGIESVEAIVEVPEIILTNEEFEDHILNAYSGWADYYEIESWGSSDGDNIYIFGKGMEEGEDNPILNYIFAWHSDNKIILNKLNNWDQSVFDDDSLEEFINAYIIKHPSDIIAEKDRCWNLDNSIRIKIDELEAEGEVVVLREGDEVFVKEFFVTQSNYGGQIWEIKDIDLNEYEVTLEDQEEGSSSIQIELLLNAEGYYSGTFTLKSGQVANINVYDNNGNHYLEATWPPESIIDTFYDCPYSREPFFIIIPEDATTEEWDLAWQFNDWVYENSLLYYGNVVETQNVFRLDLDYHPGVAIKDNDRAMVYYGQYGPAQDIVFAIDFNEYLMNLEVMGELSNVCPILSSVDIGEDIMDSFCIEDPEEGSCESCGWFSFFCDEEECLGLGEGCYFVDIPFAPNICNSCSGLTCADYLEESDCYLSHCGLECDWLDNQCIEEIPVDVQLSFSTEKDVYDLNEVIKLTQPIA